jgi:SAM-dependent methyltransferase
VLDLGCGEGRHSFAALERGASVVAADLDEAALVEVGAMGKALVSEGRVPEGGVCSALVCNALRLPFRDGSFDVVVLSEVLEHVAADAAAVAEVFRVTRPGGRLAVTVPRFWPELVCWCLSKRYRSTPGGHVRIYCAGQLIERLMHAGFVPRGAHHAHALHSPYWWLRCALGVDNEDSLPVRLYHRFLVWDIVDKPPLTRALERALNPVLGKSLVLYASKPGAGRVA